MTKTYSLPESLTTNHNANLAAFLEINAGSAVGIWRGKMLANDQRALFGQFLGKGTLVINGESEKVEMIVSVCFGTDFDVRASLDWVNPAKIVADVAGTAAIEQTQEVETVAAPVATKADLYRVFLALDTALQNALLTAYGKQAVTYRYAPEKTEPEAVRAARAAFHAASDAMFAAAR